MRCLLRNKRLLYLCNHYQAGNKMLFTEPIAININYQATNSDGDLIALGLDFPMYIRIKTDIDVATQFHPKDRIYIKNSPPSTFDTLCKDADYEVDSEPIISLNSAEITLKKLSGKNG